MNILLIAGHGQGDPGASANGYIEADLTRELALKIKTQIKAFADVTVFDTQKNMYRYLKSGNTFDFSPYDYVVEIHFNAGISANAKNDKTTTGCEILVHKNEAGVSVEKAILENISSIGFKNRGIKRRSDLQNMNIVHKSGISYALIETCFIDDNDDMKLYISKKDAVASAIAEGIMKGFGIISTPSELTTANDIVGKLADRGIITDKNLWLEKLQNDTNSYWLARKCLNYIIKRHL